MASPKEIIGFVKNLRGRRGDPARPTFRMKNQLLQLFMRLPVSEVGITETKSIIDIENNFLAIQILEVEA